MLAEIGLKMRQLAHPNPRFQYHEKVNPLSARVALI